MNHLLSSPNEQYREHIKKAKAQFHMLYPLFESNLVRLLSFYDVQDILDKMIIFHDLGKLTRRWQ
jgi:CRISPR/Cas system-associated endonuclease Cas3-HD